MLPKFQNTRDINPLFFLANGFDIYFLDPDVSAKRLIYGFFSPDDLERFLWLKQNQKPLASISIDNTITDRTYQHEAIRRVGEAFYLGKRKALIVMATGTGKTRTTMSIMMSSCAPIKPQYPFCG
jgi:type I site-specific restriction endonuclease